MAGIIFTHKAESSLDRDGVRINRRQLLAGSAVLASGLAWGATASAQTPGATPVSSPAGAPATPAGERPEGPLGSLLALIPATHAAKAAAGGVLFYYADLETQLKTLGIAQDGKFDSGNLVAALQPLATASQAFSYAFTTDFVTTFGFSPLNVHRALYVGVPPDEISIFQGGFDREQLVAAWEASGYARKSAGEGVDFWTAGENGELDLSSPVSRYGVGALNNAVIINDDVLVFARFSRIIRDVVRQAASGGPSLADQPGVGPVVSAFSERMVSAIAVTSAFLATTGAPAMTPEEQKALLAQIAESDAAVGKMPRIDVAMFGVEAGAYAATSDSATPGATPDAAVIFRENFPTASPPAERAEPPRVQVRLHAGSASDAEEIAKVVAWRWDHFTSMLANGRRYADLMTLVGSDVSATSELVAAVDFDPGQAGGRWIQLVNRRDLLPFAN